MADPDLTAAWAYETELVAKLFEPWARRAVEVAKPLTGEVVLDLACGTGIGVRLMSELVGKHGKIISVDKDPSMVCVAKQLYSKIMNKNKTETEWYDCDAESLLLDRNTLDLCTLLQGPNFLSDPTRVLKNVFDALKPSGRVVGSAWGRIEENKGHYAIATALEKLGFQTALKPFSMCEITSLQNVFTGSGFFVERMITEQKIIRFDTVKDFISGVAAGAPATRHAISQLEVNSYDYFLKLVEDILSIYSSSNEVALPTQAHIVMAMPAE